MAEQYPDIDIVAVDLAVPPVEDLPANLTIEDDNISHGLTHFHGKFDFVHARMVLSGTPNLSKALKDCYRCLKPGGCLFVVELDTNLWMRDGSAAPMALFPGDCVGGVARGSRSWLSRALRGMYFDFWWYLFVYVIARGWRGH